MRRFLPALLPLLLLAGCDGGPVAPAPGPPAAQARLKVSFPLRGLVDTIEVDAVDRQPLRTAELIAPDGVVTGSSYLNVNDSPSLATGQWAGGNPWPDAVTGNNSLAALSLQHVEGGAALRGQQQLLAVASTAEITLPDPVAYRRDWLHYHVRLVFGTPPGSAETREIAAPAPPPQ
jgi:hypothetical protein